VGDDTVKIGSGSGGIKLSTTILIQAVMGIIAFGGSYTLLKHDVDDLKEEIRNNRGVQLEVAKTLERFRTQIDFMSDELRSLQQRERRSR